MLRYYKNAKNFIINFAKLSTKQSIVVSLILLIRLLSIGSFFIVFYFMFYYDRDKTLLQNLPLLILLGVLITVYFTIVDVIKLQIEANKDPKSMMTIIVRFLFRNRYLLLFLGVYYYYTISFTSKEIYAYTAIVLLCRLLAVYTESWSLRLQNLDWRIKDGK